MHEWFSPNLLHKNCSQSVRSQQTHRTMIPTSPQQYSQCIHTSFSCCQPSSFPLQASESGESQNCTHSCATNCPCSIHKHCFACSKIDLQSDWIFPVLVSCTSTVVHILWGRGGVVRCPTISETYWQLPQLAPCCHLNRRLLWHWPHLAILFFMWSSRHREDPHTESRCKSTQIDGQESDSIVSNWHCYCGFWPTSGHDSAKVVI